MSSIMNAAFMADERSSQVCSLRGATSDLFSSR